jgi:hypothetical protein
MQALPEEFKDWTQVPIFMPNVTHFSWALNKVWHWCESNCEDRFDALFENHGGYKIWIFKSPEDATVFKLVWSHG